MDGIRDIRPLYPVVPAKHRDRKPPSQDQDKAAKRPDPKREHSDGDPDPPSIDEYA